MPGGTKQALAVHLPSVVYIYYYYPTGFMDPIMLEKQLNIFIHGIKKEVEKRAKSTFFTRKNQLEIQSGTAKLVHAVQI